MPLVETTSNNERRAAALRAEVEAYRVGTVETPKRRPPNRKGAAAVAPDAEMDVGRFVGQSPLRRRRLVEQRRAAENDRELKEVPCLSCPLPPSLPLLSSMTTCSLA